MIYVGRFGWHCRQLVILPGSVWSDSVRVDQFGVPTGHQVGAGSVKRSTCENVWQARVCQLLLPKKRCMQYPPVPTYQPRKNREYCDVFTSECEFLISPKSRDPFRPGRTRVLLDCRLCFDRRALPKVPIRSNSETVLGTFHQRSQVYSYIPGIYIYIVLRDFLATDVQSLLSM